MKNKVLFIATLPMGLVGLLNLVLVFNQEKYRSLLEYTNLLSVFTVILFFVVYAVFAKRRNNILPVVRGIGETIYYYQKSYYNYLVNILYLVAGVKITYQLSLLQ